MLLSLASPIRLHLKSLGISGQPANLRNTRDNSSTYRTCSSNAAGKETLLFVASPVERSEPSAVGFGPLRRRINRLTGGDHVNNIALPQTRGVNSTWWGG